MQKTNTSDNFVYTARNNDPMHEGISHIGYILHGNSRAGEKTRH